MSNLTPDDVLKYGDKIENSEWEPWVITDDGGKHRWRDLARQLLQAREAIRGALKDSRYAFPQKTTVDALEACLPEGEEWGDE